MGRLRLSMGSEAVCRHGALLSFRWLGLTRLGETTPKAHPCLHRHAAYKSVFVTPT